MIEIIKEYFPNGRFNPPANEQDILEAEKELGIKIPTVLRELFLSFDGFREGYGNAAYLLPLKKDEGAGSIVRTNKFFWEDYKQYYPNLDFSKYLFFGSSCSDDIWGINLSTESEIIAYHHHMEDEYEIVGSNILEVYIKDQELSLEVTKGI